MGLIDTIKPLRSTALSSSAFNKRWQHRQNFRNARNRTRDDWVWSTNATSVLWRPPCCKSLCWFIGLRFNATSEADNFGILNWHALKRLPIEPGTKIERCDKWTCLDFRSIKVRLRVEAQYRTCLHRRIPPHSFDLKTPSKMTVTVAPLTLIHQLLN